MLEALIPKTKRLILGFLFSHPGESFYRHEIIRAIGYGGATVQRTLTALTENGILTSSRRGRHVFFQANPECPIYHELLAIIIKTVGVADFLAEPLKKARNIKAAFIYGSFAKGDPSSWSDVDLMVVGDIEFGTVVKILHNAERKLGREINSIVYPPAEFRDKIEKNHHFLANVMKEEKIFIIGDERTLKNLVK